MPGILDLPDLPLGHVAQLLAHTDHRTFDALSRTCTRMWRICRTKSVRVDFLLTADPDMPASDRRPLIECMTAEQDYPPRPDDMFMTIRFAMLLVPAAQFMADSTPTHRGSAIEAACRAQSIDALVVPASSPDAPCLLSPTLNHHILDILRAPAHRLRRLALREFCPHPFLNKDNNTRHAFLADFRTDLLAHLPGLEQVDIDFTFGLPSSCAHRALYFPPKLRMLRLSARTVGPLPSLLFSLVEHATALRHMDIYAAHTSHMSVLQFKWAMTNLEVLKLEQFALWPNTPQPQLCCFGPRPAHPEYVAKNLRTLSLVSCCLDTPEISPARWTFPHLTSLRVADHPGPMSALMSGDPAKRMPVLSELVLDLSDDDLWRVARHLSGLTSPSVRDCFLATPAPCTKLLALFSSVFPNAKIHTSL